MSSDFTPIPFTLWQDAPERFADRLGHAFRETGFAVVSGHTVPEETIARADTAMRAFFALPEAVKARYDDSARGGQRGYTPFARENAKGQSDADLKEFWHRGRGATAGAPHASAMRATPSVGEVADFDAATGGLFEALDRMGGELLEAVALHLGLSRDWFDAKVRAGNSILRLLHYPAQDTPPPPGSVRAAAHEDINVITLLLGAEEAGLEVRHRSGAWHAINPPPGALVVNVGDMLDRLTAGRLPSTTHRVVNPTAARAHLPRYSMPFFLHFAPDVVIEPLAGCLDDDARPEPPITAHAYLMQRLHEIGLLE
jgi:isopenicillin N synthase-like dioxygenase